MSFIFPWQRYRFKKSAQSLDWVDIKNRVKRCYGDVNVQAGDSAVYALTKQDSDAMWAGLPTVDDSRYTRGMFDCEDFSRRRLCQIIDFASDWTDLDAPPAIFEIRGYTQKKLGDATLKAGESVLINEGHSCLLEFYADGTAALREPYSTLQIKPISNIHDPWLVYL